MMIALYTSLSVRLSHEVFFHGSCSHKLSFCTFHILRGTFEYLTPKMRNCNICLIWDKGLYATSQMCPLKQLCAPNHGCRGCKIDTVGAPLFEAFLISKSVILVYF